MASADSLWTRSILKKGVVGQVVDDTPVAIRLSYVGTGSVTSVTVTTATNIVMVTSDGGTDTYAFATYTTVGALVDKINADGIFQARILDAVRASTTASSFVNGAITVSSANYYDVLSDTSGANELAYRLTYSRATPVNGATTSFLNGHRVHLQQIAYNVTLGGGADTNSLTIVEWNPNTATETVIYQATPTSGSAQTVSWASGEGYITANDGNDLIVRITDATSITGVLTPSGFRE